MFTLTKTESVNSIRKGRVVLWLLTLLALGLFWFLYHLTGGIVKNIVGVVITFSILLSLQNLFTLIWMLYGWSGPDSENLISSPKQFLPPSLSFTALLPARHEEKVIGDTIRALNNVNYPKELTEVLVLCRIDDVKTIDKVKEIIAELKNKNIKLVTFDSDPINKPHALNIGLKNATSQIVTIFDAEDEPHPDLYNVINTVMVREGVDIVQSGVQLMNYESKWFSALNVLEYYFWFKSGLHFFSKFCSAAPLAGNSVFLKRSWLNQVGGWDENCLTEDADIGVRLELAGATVRVIYDEEYVTREETPTDAQSFVKQRTRWNQGFIQILLKGNWLHLVKLRQKLVSLYIFTAPLINGVLLVYIPLGFFVAMTQKLPLFLTLLSYSPMYLMLVQLSIYVIGIYKFTKEYKKRFSLSLVIHLIITYYPYQFLLAIASFRAIFRELFGVAAWEKTKHINNHRQ